MSIEASLSIPADVKQLERIRRFVEQEAQSLNVDPSAVYDLVLAVNEMATNIITHGYSGHPGEIEIAFRQAGDAVEICLRDRAPPFDPTCAPVPDISVPLYRRRLGGMGIHVTRQLMDSMLHRIPPWGGNELTLVKRGVVPNRTEA
ncbi:MAG: ATP-binding protein [Kouleothrix sp.]|nr:ATP-binding protein [Kouleothrix sp.]